MGAKFKAPLDSCCSAEQQHFRLPFPSYVCLSFPLLSFYPLAPCLSFIPSLVYLSSPSFSSRGHLTLFSVHPYFFPLSPPPSVISFPPFDSAAHLLLFTAPLCISIRLSSLTPVFQTWQTLISAQQQGCRPGASLFRGPTSHPGRPNQAQKETIAGRRRPADICPDQKAPRLVHPSLSLSKMALPQMFNSSYLLIKRSSKPPIDVKASIWICNHPLRSRCCAQRNFPRIFW